MKVVLKSMFIIFCVGNMHSGSVATASSRSVITMATSELAQALITHIDEGDEQEAHTILDHPSAQNITGLQLERSLLMAAIGGHRSIVRRIIEHDNAVDLSPLTIRMAIRNAAGQGYGKIVEKLLSAPVLHGKQMQKEFLRSYAAYCRADTQPLKDFLYAYYAVDVLGSSLSSDIGLLREIDIGRFFHIATINQMLLSLAEQGSVEEYEMLKAIAGRLGVPDVDQGPYASALQRAKEAL